jgi:hypothetical protein
MDFPSTTLACVVFCVSTVACMQPVSATVDQQPAAAPVWHATMRLSGGLLGLDQEVTVASTGDLKVIDRRGQIEVAKKASATELAQIASMVADLKPVEAARDSLCMDCPQYDLSVQANGRSVVASLNFISLAGSPVEPLVKALAALLDRELGPPGTQGR